MSNALDSVGPIDDELEELNGGGHGGSDPLDAFDFDDIFAQDAALSQRLDRIVDLVEVSDQGRKAEFSYNADEHQRRFIDSPARTIRLLAPAGSGKTQSIVNRVLARVADGEAIQGFLILTFDNAAAISLRDKFDQGIKESGLSVPSQPNVSTLNRFGYQLLRGVLRDRYGLLSVGTPDSDGHEAVRKALWDLKDRSPETYALLPPKLARRVYLDLISTLKNRLILADDLFRRDDPTARARLLEHGEELGFLNPWLAPHRGSPAWDEAKTKVVSALCYIYKRYCDVNKNHQRIDFDDQKLLAYLGLRDNPQLARLAMSAFRTVIVDEFQDINLLDYEFIRLVSGDKALIVVGDDDQAIYGFRGCSPDYILKFDEQIGREVETHVLRVNYRCPENVVEMGNRLIAHNTNRIEKDQVAARKDRADVKLWHCLNGASEAQVIARFIKRLHLERSSKGFRFSDVAILLRINAQSLPLQIALILEEIPYHCRRDENIIVSTTMRNLISLIGLHLGLRADPGHHSHEATRLIFDCLARYARPEEVDRFHKQVVRAGGYGAVGPGSGGVALPRNVTWAEYRQAIGALTEEAAPVQIVERIGTTFRYMSGLVGTLEEALNNHMPLGEFVDIASRFRGTTAQFHEMIGELLGKVEGGLFHPEEGDAVNLLTYFRAKGRQWHTVVLPGANQKLIPLPWEDVEGERRLFYVAVTRATHNLIVSYVRQAVRSKVDPSQFLAEMGLHEAEEKRAGLMAPDEVASAAR